MAVEQFPRKPVERPHTEILVDSSAITGASSGSDKLVMVLGAAKGGKPNTVYKVRNYVQAKSIFRGGELLDALEMAWNPSGSTAGAGDILAMRVEDAKAATVTQGPIVFSSKLYGEEANQTQVTLETEELAGKTSRNLTVSFLPDGYEATYRNIGDIMTITYDGADAYAAVEVVEGRLTLFTGADAATASTKVFQLGANSQANVLANDINSIAGFNAKMPTSGNKNIRTNGLDTIAKTVIDEDGVKITGLIADIVKQLEYDDYVAVKVNGAAQLADFGPVTLQGGEDGVVPETWADKISLFANEGGYYLVPLTDRPAVHAEALSFVTDRSNQGDPMRVIAGAGFNESPEQLLGRASSLRNGRFMLIGFSGTINMTDGRIQEVPAYMYAAQVAGLASGLPIGSSITFKQITLTNLSTIYDGAQLDTLNSGGVVMAEFVRNRQNTNFRLVDDVTTYNDNSDPVRNQMAVGEANDFLVSEMKIKLDNDFIGTKVIDISASLIKNSIQSFLDQKKRDQEIQDYSPEEVQVVIDGEVAQISMVIFPIRSLKKIEVSLTYKQQVLSS